MIAARTEELERLRCENENLQEIIDEAKARPAQEQLASSRDEELTRILESSQLVKQTEDEINSGQATAIVPFVQSCPIVEEFRIPDVQQDDAARQITITEGVAEVSAEMLAARDAVEVVIPESVQTIAEGAFCGLASLGAVCFDPGSQLHKICARAFAGTTLRAFSAPPSLEELGDYAFSGCASLESVDLGEGLRTIGKGCFEKSGLRSVQVPQNVVEIGDDAFLRCGALRKVGFAPDAHLERIGAGAFSETNLIMFMAPRGLREVGEEAFYLCAGLSYVQLNDCLEVLGVRSFWCSGL